MPLGVYLDSRVTKEISMLQEEASSGIALVISRFKEDGFSLSQQHLKKLTKDIWELRTGRYRLLFSLIGSSAIITNVFYKTTQQTPLKEIKLAYKRAKIYEK